MVKQNTAESGKKTPIWSHLLLGAAFVALCLQIIVFMLVALRLSSDDDQMYAGAAYLWGQTGPLYGEIPFLQMPYAAVLYRGLSALVGSDYYISLVWLNLSFAVLSAWLLSWVVLRLTRTDAVAGLWAFSAILGCTSLFYNASILGNHAILLLLASLLAIVIVERTPTPKRAFVAGGLAGLAIGFKLSGVALVLPLLWWLCRPNLASWRKAGFAGWPAFLSAMAGGAVALAPVLLFMLPDTAAFWQLNVTFHQQAYSVREGGWLFSFSSVLNVLLSDVTLLTIPVLILVLKSIRYWPGLGTLLVWGAAGLLIALLPGVPYSVHMAVLQCFGAMIVVTGAVFWLQEKQPQIPQRLILLVFLLFQALFGLSHGWDGLVNSEAQGFARVQDQLRLQTSVNAALKGAVCTQQIVTVSPIPALTSGVSIHPLGGAGAFIVNTYPDPATAPPLLQRWADIAGALTAQSAYLTHIHPPLKGEEAAVARALELGLTPHVIGKLYDYEQPRDAVLYLPKCE